MSFFGVRLSVESVVRPNRKDSNRDPQPIEAAVALHASFLRPHIQVVAGSQPDPQTKRGSTV